MRYIVFCLVYLMVALVGASAMAHEAHPELAFGFERERIVKTPFLITDVEFDPTGTMWLLDKGGGVYQVREGNLSASLLQLSVATDKERGEPDEAEIA